MASIKSFVSNFLRIKPVDQVPAAVAKNFRHNVIVNSLDIALFTFGDSFVSIMTIIPVFAAGLTDSPLLIGLIPAIVNAGWFLPQMFVSGYVSRLKKKLPFTRRMAVIERIPYLFFPVLALLVPSIPKNTAVLFLFILLTWRGFASGMVALPWQEVLASVIPRSHRSRFFGVSRFFSQIAGIIGSLIASLLLSRVAYPYNYALGFSIAVLAQWVSYAVYSQNREPEYEESKVPEAEPTRKLVDFKLFAGILQSDKNFRFYLIARSMMFFGVMAGGFLAVYGLKRFGVGDDQAAVFTGLIYASGFVGYSLGGIVGDRIGPKRILALALVFWIACVVGAILAPNIWVYYIVFILFGLYTAWAIMGDSILVMELGTEELRPTYLGMARSLTGIFLLLAPLLAGSLVSAFGYPLMFYVSIGLTLLSLALLSKVRDLPRATQPFEPSSKAIPED